MNLSDNIHTPQSSVQLETWNLGSNHQPLNSQDNKILDIFLQFSKSGEFSQWVEKNHDKAEKFFKLLDDTDLTNSTDKHTKKTLMTKFSGLFPSITVHLGGHQKAIPLTILKDKLKSLELALTETSIPEQITKSSEPGKSLELDLVFSNIGTGIERIGTQNINSIIGNADKVSNDFLNYLAGESISINNENDLKLFEMANYFEFNELEDLCLQSIKGRLTDKGQLTDDLLDKFIIISKPYPRLKFLILPLICNNSYDLDALSKRYLNDENSSFVTELINLANEIKSSDKLILNKKSDGFIIEIKLRNLDSLNFTEFSQLPITGLYFNSENNFGLFNFKKDDTIAINKFSEIFPRIDELKMNNVNIEQLPVVWMENIKDLDVYNCHMLRNVTLLLANKVKLSSCDRIKMVNVPVSENLYIYFCHELESVMCPQSTTLKIDSCQMLTDIYSPESINVEIKVCQILKKLELPKAKYVTLNSCYMLEKAFLPETIQFELIGCKFENIDLPKAQIVKCSLTAFDNLNIPEAREVRINTTSRLKSLSAPKATEVFCSFCRDFKSLYAPVAKTVDIKDCPNLWTYAPKALKLSFHVKLLKLWNEK